MDTILEVNDLKKYFRERKGMFGARDGFVKAVDGVDLAVERGSTFGLVGESGCGKSTIARLITGILRPDSGRISAQGDIDMVFQDPYGSLNPRMTVGQIVGESLRIRGVPPATAAEKTAETLSMVKLSPGECLDRYPHQFSGGERQRIAIARALVRRPGLIVLDEPVSSLDVSIQAGILNLLKDLQEELVLTYLLISHDLRVVEFMSDTVAVMKSGKIVETAPPERIYSSPSEEYTRELLEAIPKFGHKLWKKPE